MKLAATCTALAVVVAFTGAAIAAGLLAGIGYLRYLSVRPA